MLYFQMVGLAWAWKVPAALVLKYRAPPIHFFL